MRAALLFVVLLVGCVLAADVKVEVERIVNLASSVVREDHYYDVTNTGSAALTSFQVAVPLKNLSEWDCNQSETSRALTTEQLTAIPHAVVENRIVNDLEYLIVEVTFPNALELNQRATILLNLAYTHQLTPKPKTIKQDELQKMYFEGNLHVQTLQPAKQTTEVRSMQIIDYTKSAQPAVLNPEQQVLTLGPYENVPAWSTEPFFVHVFNTATFVTVDQLVKEIEVSHWGNIAVEESWTLHNAGAALKGSFSRMDYMRGQGGNSIREFVQWLPRGAVDLYYRDIIGNISTSHAFPHAENVKFEIQPRFVMFGGWKNEFKTGYNMPASRYMGVEDGSYVLAVPFVNEFENAVIDEMEVRIILPEGAYDVQVVSSVHTYDQSESVRQTYLDTSGRVVVTLRASNLISEHRHQNLVVTYKFATSTMIREPLFLIAAYFGLFMLAIAYFRSNWSLSDLPASGSLSAAELKAQKLSAELAEIFDTMEAKFEIGAVETQKSLQKKLAKFNADMTAVTNRVQTLSSKLSVVRSDLGNRSRRLEKLLKQKVATYRQKMTLSKAPATDALKAQLAHLNEEFSKATASINNEVEALVEAASRSDEE